jgi:cytochrome b561
VSKLRVDSRHPGSDAPERYGAVAIALHWLIAVLILGQILFGWYLQEIPRGTPMRGFYVNLHKSTGLTIALLILVRLGWRLAHPPPPLPSFVPAWERVASRISHLALYVCMLVMPSSGYVASNFSKFGVKLFNVILLPPWGIDDKRIYAVFNTTHVVTSYLFVGLIALHVLAAVHHALRHDGVFGRMWPWPRPAERAQRPDSR